jgi:hypothetical protein
MDFQHGDIRRFLIDSIPTRFSQLGPAEFESFVAFLFGKDGYAIEPISRKGDLHANFLARKEGVSLVIRALRYPPEVLVPVKEIQQAAAARTYYETDQSWIITNSGFTEESKTAAEELDIELWDWEVFYNALSQLFFEGKGHLEFSDGIPPIESSDEREAAFKLKVKWQPEEGVSSEWYNLEMRVSNVTDRNIYIHLDLPAFIDMNRNQVMAEKWADQEFISGMVYSGASVRTNALFKASRLGERPPGGRIVLTCHERSEPPATFHLASRIKGSACYLVTFCYTRESEEYRLMVRFRDDFLTRMWAGRLLIGCYYRLSPYLIEAACRMPGIGIIVKKLTHLIVRLCTISIRIK